MFLDPFIFAPPKPEALTCAVESYQRVAAARFFNYVKAAEDPGRFPFELTGDKLEPTSRQLHAEVRALRHLTAIQRTLREIGGPLFNPASPIPPRQRFRLVERRLDAIEEALGELDDGVPEDGSVLPAAPGDFELHAPKPGDDFYHPPEIEALLSAVDFAQRVFAARARLLDERRLKLSSEDFLLEIMAIRDLTAVIRTLRRMSAHRLPEDEPLPEVDAASPTELQDSSPAAEGECRPEPESDVDAGARPAPPDPIPAGPANPVDVSEVTAPGVSIRGLSVPRVPEVRSIPASVAATCPSTTPGHVPPGAPSGPHAPAPPRSAPRPPSYDDRSDDSTPPTPEKCLPSAGITADRVRRASGIPVLRDSHAPPDDPP